MGRIQMLAGEERTLTSSNLLLLFKWSFTKLPAVVKAGSSSAQVKGPAKRASYQTSYLTGILLKVGKFILPNLGTCFIISKFRICKSKTRIHINYCFFFFNIHLKRRGLKMVALTWETCVEIHIFPFFYFPHLRKRRGTRDFAKLNYPKDILQS